MDNTYTKEFAEKLYETMSTIRHFEVLVKHDFLAGEIPGFTHSYIGEEAIATGVCAALRDDDVVEITCDITPQGAVPHKFDNIDEQNFEIIRRVKIYERLASSAIREKSVQSAIEALTMHPLVNSYSLSKKLINDYLELNKEYVI